MLEERGLKARPNCYRIRKSRLDLESPLLSSLKLCKSAFPKLWVATHGGVVDAISMGRESHSKFKLTHALSQII